MSLLVKDSPLLVLPVLVKEVGLNEAMLLQQLHFRSRYSRYSQDGHKWVVKSHKEWQAKNFPFWSMRTIQRTIEKLEEQGYIISTSAYNKMKIDKTKWYRIDYSKSAFSTGQNGNMDEPECLEGIRQSGKYDVDMLSTPITKEINKTNKDIVEKDLDVVSVIHYLNAKTGKEFKATSKATVRLVNARFQDGYELDDFKQVIDTKVKDWLNAPRWNKYLRPSTLFNATNFENYLEESKGGNESQDLPVSGLPKPFELDFSKGEE